jgi:hypothetical protein
MTDANNQTTVQPGDSAFFQVPYNTHSYSVSNTGQRNDTTIVYFWIYNIAGNSSTGVAVNLEPGTTSLIDPPAGYQQDASGDNVGPAAFVVFNNGTSPVNVAQR